MARQEKLEELLRPIQWDWSSSIRSRQNLVGKRHAEVRAAYPFMSDEEKAEADKWFKREAHSGLWD